jgi:hypothetical protein
MSEFAFFRFRSHNLLTKEEQEHKVEIVQLTEEVLQARGIQCDASISKISEDELKEILVKVRELRKKKKKQESAKQEEDYVYNTRITCIYNTRIRRRISERKVAAVSYPR